MKTLNGINRIRRSIMKSLTKNIGQLYQESYLQGEIEIKKILISRPNHRLGNLLLITPLVQEVIDTFPDCKIDLFVKGSLAPVIFSNYENIDDIIQLPKKPFGNIIKYIRVWILIRNRRYDLVINANQDSSSGKLSALFSNSHYKFFGEFDTKKTDYQHIAKSPVYNFRDYMTKLGFPENCNIIPTLNIRLHSEEIEDGGKKLDRIVKNSKKTICLFTNATGEKCYSESWWGVFYEQLKNEFPDYNIIEILPIESTSKLGYKIPSFYSTNIREIGSLIANTVLFIGADSGVMHLASSVGTPTIGLFSITETKVYEPYGKNSFGINTNKIGSIERIDLIKKILTENTAKPIIN